MADYRTGVLLDLDGTLVDSVFHHVVTWHQALREHGHAVPMWRVHAAIGMGSDRLVPWVLGGHVHEASEISDRHQQLFLERADGLLPTNGARALIEDLKTRDVPFLVATSARKEERAALLQALGMKELETADADDVGSSKPAPDLLLVACEQVGVPPSHVTMVGDSPWDQVAAKGVGIRPVAVRTGGFGDGPLLGAGADAIVDDPRELIGRL